MSLFKKNDKKLSKYDRARVMYMLYEVMSRDLAASRYKNFTVTGTALDIAASDAIYSPYKTSASKRRQYAAMKLNILNDLRTLSYNLDGLGVSNNFSNNLIKASSVPPKCRVKPPIYLNFYYPNFAFAYDEDGEMYQYNYTELFNGARGRGILTKSPYGGFMCNEFKFIHYVDYAKYGINADNIPLEIHPTEDGFGNHSIGLKVAPFSETSRDTKKYVAMCRLMKSLSRMNIDPKLLEFDEKTACLNYVGKEDTIAYHYLTSSIFCRSDTNPFIGWLAKIMFYENPILFGDVMFWDILPKYAEYLDWVYEQTSIFVDTLNDDELKIMYDSFSLLYDITHIEYDLLFYQDNNTFKDFTEEDKIAYRRKIYSILTRYDKYVPVFRRDEFFLNIFGLQNNTDEKCIKLDKLCNEALFSHSNKESDVHTAENQYTKKQVEIIEKYLTETEETTVMYVPHRRKEFKKDLVNEPLYRDILQITK